MTQPKAGQSPFSVVFHRFRSECPTPLPDLSSNWLLSDLVVALGVKADFLNGQG